MRNLSRRSVFTLHLRFIASILDVVVGLAVKLFVELTSSIRIEIMIKTKADMVHAVK